ncbi:hypothetical protein [Caulobacter zeae]|nr:hypothetical protein [Caulobacter zeae]
MRVQRLVRSAERLASGGYRAAFGLRPPQGLARRTAAIWRSSR